MCDHLRIIIEVIVHELGNKKLSEQIANRYIDFYTFELPEDLSFNGIYKDNIIKYIEGLKNKASDEINEENSVENVIYRCLFAIYRNTTQRERFLYLHDLLEYLYQQLVQKIIQLQEYSLLISKNDFIRKVRVLLPHVKVHNIKSVSEASIENEGFKEALIELCEAALYPIILREDCYEIIKSKVCIEKTIFVNFEVKTVQVKNGFLCDYLKLRISIIRSEGDHEDHFFFVKCMPNTAKIDATRKYLVESSFKKEELYYRQFIPSVAKLVSAEMTDFVPRSYYSVQNQFIVLDDTTKNNFANIEVNVPLSYDQILLIMKQLAKMHAASMIYEEKLSKKLNKPFRSNDYYTEMLKEAMDINDKTVQAYFECSIRTVNYLFEKCKNRFKDFDVEDNQKKVREGFYKMCDIIKPSDKSRNFVTHGDLWCNNIVFKDDQSSCLLLDLQMVRYSSPVYDVCIVLALNTDQDTRREYSKRLLDDYYTDLKDNLSKYGINIKDVLSYRTGTEYRSRY
uniref:Uncharacterized protein LOC114335722 n=1 Tax=Diabrotica virgifera virgifera TaxID=50390 RepID=A0A6P7GAF9_DIAVI